MKSVKDERTRGQRLADWVTEFSGSWTFIFAFSGLLAVWFISNSVLYWFGVFDPYPYIFLNLVLTVVSTFQGPLILMSQTRQNEHEEANRHAVREQLDRIETELALLGRLAKLTKH